MKKFLITASLPFYWMAWILMIFLVGACEKNIMEKDMVDCDESIHVPIHPLVIGESACGTLGISLAELPDEKAYVISKPEEIGSLKLCAEGNEEEFDLEKEFLVGVRICSACGILRKQEVTYQCNKLIYSIEIENLDCHAVTCSDYLILIPAEYADLPIEMDITKIDKSPEK